MSARTLLDRLDAVRLTGSGRWVARCPAHHDRSPSLRIRELDDERVLLHDFGGCSTGDVLKALGLSLLDLFPQRTGQHARARSAAWVPIRDAVFVFDHEAHVVAVIAADLMEQRKVDEPTWQRLALAVQRIADARLLVAPLRERGVQ